MDRRVKFQMQRSMLLVDAISFFTAFKDFPLFFNSESTLPCHWLPLAAYVCRRAISDIDLYLNACNMKTLRDNACRNPGINFVFIHILVFWKIYSLSMYNQQDICIILLYYFRYWEKYFDLFKRVRHILFILCC